MNRIDRAFADAKRRQDIALVCFVTCGDPSFEMTQEIVLSLVEAGADLIELGVPFSDPLADGPSIQASSFRALQGGASVRGVLQCVRSIRQKTDVPLVLMTYYNPVHKYGPSRFAEDAAEAGADGVIITDLAFEEASDWKSAADKAGVATIQLIAPTSTKDRIALGAKLASGFIYCVSRTGVTGAKDEIPAELKEQVAAIKSVSDLPVAVGFGISKPEHVMQVAEFADGAVVGSALVDLIATSQGSHDAARRAAEFVRGLKACLPRNNSRS